MVPAVFIQIFSFSRNVGFIGGPEEVKVLTPGANRTRIFREHSEEQSSTSGLMSPLTSL